MLPEANIFNNIQATVAQARLAYQASEAGDSKERNEAATLCLEALNKAVAELGEFEETVQAKIEQIPSGRPKVTHPKRGDPYYRLLQKAVPFIIELRDDRDNLAAQLGKRRN